MSEELALTLIRTDAKGSIACQLASCRLPSFPDQACVVSSFTGTIDNINPNAGVYGYMHEMIGAGYAACNPATLILDLRGLEFESGDYMCRILDQRLITKVIVSDLNRTGLTALVRNVLFLDPKTELFETLPDALIACDSAYREFLRDGRKKTIAADF